ncbi:Clp protease N-terminal domain-containing protein [Parafrankia sp. EUN1f]|uniref:Clp protease N-terminal domain-containing protein n=1 Tax=Parafrankia sp. EUN1f TaxID=102897 RepID=UPI0001C462F4|nr:Clp protease N-terminal domain-containing protein [Parafrankia sp. EUN1f]EFC82254.1 Clp domain protein [Parafrankia sp. EUN1f]
MKFTQEARRVIELSQEEAHRLHHNAIRTEHLLLGLLHEETGHTSATLRSLGVTLDNTRVLAEELGEELGGDSATEPGRHLPFTPRARGVLERAARQALTHSHDHLDTAHLLLALLGEDTRGGNELLTRLGADPEQARRQTLAALTSPPAST